MTSKRVLLQGVGDILLERSSRAKHINLSVKPFKGVRVAVPKGVTFDVALNVARAKSTWLKKHMGRMASIEKQILAQQVQPVINRSQARRILVSRLAELARCHGFSYNRVFIRNQKTRWGSCSTQNNINLNIKLVRLPDRLRDYTILHELVHTRIKHHGPAFWSAMASLVSEPKQLDQELNGYWMLLDKSAQELAHQ
ncbi:MAG: M48 family metallopeptidase [Desulfatitalea sp.]|nr:M48 family metallopeptidase [Desulfatitalea sp.]NNK02372.1 M48 family metallopeptidase [Desulfatitalea sp.]